MVNDDFTSLTFQLKKFEEDHKRVKQRMETLEKLVEKRDKTIKSLKGNLKLLKEKCKVYINIINNNTTVKVSDIWSEKDNEIHFHYYTKDFKIINHTPQGEKEEKDDENDDEEKDEEDDLERSESSGRSERSDLITESIEQNDIKPQEKELIQEKEKEPPEKESQEKEPPEKENIKKTRVSMTRKTIQGKIQDISPLSVEEKKKIEDEKSATIFTLEEYKENINKVLLEIKNGRTNKKYLEELKKIKLNLFEKSNIVDYTDYLQNIIKRLEVIFVSKNTMKKTIKTNILSMLTNLDLRLIFYDKYYDTVLDPDDIKLFKKTVQNSCEYPTEYKPFKNTELFKNFCTYSIFLLSIKELLLLFIKNRYNIFNIVYVNFHHKTVDDPYSFYTLDRVIYDKGVLVKRIWKMDCRAESLSIDISSFLLKLSIDMFRKVYFTIFNDYKYRKNYKDKSRILNEDCEQLRINFLGLSKQRSICDLLRKLLVKHCTHQATVVDEFALQTDDKIVKKRFEDTFLNCKETLVDNVKIIFDGITEEEIEEFICEKTVSCDSL